MIRLQAIAALLLLAVPTAAVANTVECGGNAFTYAEVVDAKPGARTKGPITSMPDSLCADLIEARPRQVDSLNVSVGEPLGAAGSLSSTQGRLQQRRRGSSTER